MAQKNFSLAQNTLYHMFSNKTFLKNWIEIIYNYTDMNFKNVLSWYDLLYKFECKSFISKQKIITHSGSSVVHEAIQRPSDAMHKPVWFYRANWWGFNYFFSMKKKAFYIAIKRIQNMKPFLPIKLFRKYSFHKVHFKRLTY